MTKREGIYDAAEEAVRDKPSRFSEELKNLSNDHLLLYFMYANRQGHPWAKSGWSWTAIYDEIISRMKYD